MKKVFNVLLTVVLLFAFCVTVNAKNITVDDIITQVKADNPSLSSVSATTNTSDSSKLDIIYGGSTVMTVDFVNGVMTYDGTNASSITDMVLENILNAVFKLQDQNKTGAEFKSEVQADANKYSYSKHKVEATLNGSNNYSYVKLDTNNVNLSGQTSTSGGSSEANPKTGVFIPVFGISILIIGSVVCLLWIGKNSVFKGF